MGCRLRIRLNELSSLWYTIGVLLLQIYLLYLGFERYRLYQDVKWPQHQYPSVWLSSYMILYSTCIPMCMFFFATGFFKTGNLAGDREQLGMIESNVCEITKSKRNLCCSMFKSVKNIWKNFLPFPQTLHITMAFCQLLGQQIMLSQMYRFNFMNTNDIINTEADFIYKRANQLALNLPVGDTKLQGFRITSEELSYFPISPNLLPILMHTKLFGIPLEFVNLIIALIAFAQRYPRLFWKVSEPFSILFSLFMVIHGITIVYSYFAFSLLYRIQETNRYNIRPLTIGLPMASSKNLIFYHPISIIALFITDLAILMLAPLALHLYGLSKYKTVIATTKQRMSLLHHKLSAPPASSNSGGYYQGENTFSINKSNQCCDGYGSHMVAILVLILTAITQCPTIYALMVLYQYENKTILLHCIVVRIVYLFAWIILWLILTLIKNWNFRVSHPVEEIINIQNAHKLIELSNEDDNQHHINPSKLKNAMLLMQGEYMYLTNDNMMKQSVINLVHKNKIENGVLMPKYKMSPIVKRVLGSERPSPIPQHRPYDYSQQNLYNSQTGSQAQLNNQMRMSPAKDVHRPLITPQYTWAESGVSKQGSTVQMNDHTEHGFVNSFGTLQRTNKPNDEMCGSLRGVPTSILSGQHYGTLQNRPINPVRYSPIRHRPQPPIQQQIYDPKFQASSLYGTYGRQENMQQFNNKALNPIINKQPPQYMMNKDGTNNKILSPQTINKNGLALSYTGTLSSSNKQYETSSQFLPPSTHSAVRENSFGNYGYKKGLSTGINVPSKGNDDRFENIYGQISESSNLKKLVSVNESPRSNHSNDETVAKGMTEYATSIV